MEVIIWILFILVFYVIYVGFKSISKNKNQDKSYEVSKEFENNEQRLDFIRSKYGLETYELVEKVKTPVNLQSLENKYQKLEDKMRDGDYTSKYDEKLEILDNASNLASYNPFKYYYYEEPNLFTPLEELNYIGKLLNVEDYNSLDENIKGCFDVITVGDVEDIQEAKEFMNDNIEIANVKDLQKLRKILESDLEDQEKEKKYNSTVFKSESLIKLFSFKCDNYYQQLKDIEKLQNSNAY